MSPQSLLYTPVDLLQSAPPNGASTPHGEGVERRAALWVFCALLALGAIVITPPITQRPACADQPPAHGARSCSPA